MTYQEVMDLDIDRVWLKDNEQTKAFKKSALRESDLNDYVFSHFSEPNRPGNLSYVVFTHKDYVK